MNTMGGGSSVCFVRSPMIPSTFVGARVLAAKRGRGKTAARPNAAASGRVLVVGAVGIRDRDGRGILDEGERDDGRGVVELHRPRELGEARVLGLVFGVVDLEGL